MYSEEIETKIYLSIIFVNNVLLVIIINSIIIAFWISTKPFGQCTFVSLGQPYGFKK